MFRSKERVPVLGTWKCIAEYQNLYAVSSEGLIKRNAVTLVKSNGVLCSVMEKQITTRVGRGGYYTVRLNKNNISKTYYVHRLVAEAYVENPNAKPFVNHKNGIKTDNRAENLEWVTHKENVEHAYRIGLNTNVGGTHPNATKVINICTGESWNTIKEAAKDLGISEVIFRNRLKKGIHCFKKNRKTRGQEALPFSLN